MLYDGQGKVDILIQRNLVHLRPCHATFSYGNDPECDDFPVVMPHMPY